MCVVWVWYACGIGHGMGVVWVWYGCGTSVVWVWYVRGMCMVRVWYGRGTGVVKAWYMCGRGMGFLAAWDLLCEENDPGTKGAGGKLQFYPIFGLGYPNP